MLPPERVAAAKYAKRRVLATATETRFGTFVHDAAHAHRAPATQLVNARPASDAVARFTHVGVHPDAEDRGIGFAMVGSVVERCPLPAGRIVVCATEAIAGFYERLGFVRNNVLWRFARLPRAGNPAPDP